LAPFWEWSAQGIRASCSAAPILAPLRGGYIGASGAHSLASLRSAAGRPSSPAPHASRAPPAPLRGRSAALDPRVPAGQPLRAYRAPRGARPVTPARNDTERSTWRQDRARLSGSSQNSSTRRPDCHSRGTGTRSGRRGLPGPSSTTWSTTAEGAERRHVGGQAGAGGHGEPATSLAPSPSSAIVAPRRAAPTAEDPGSLRAIPHNQHPVRNGGIVKGAFPLDHSDRPCHSTLRGEWPGTVTVTEGLLGNGTPSSLE
jgi:hypothetical protein